jgi:2-C-methyl-D-erythritol 4-phosphate cytidylyltransferase
MRAAALLLAAGKGERLGGAVEKGLVDLAGRPLLAYSIETVDACPAIDSLVIAAPAGREDEVKDLASRSGKLHTEVTGGDTRQASVRSALDGAPEEFDAVACHDVARPFASTALFERTLDALSSADGAVPAVPLADSVKLVRGESILETVDRDDLVAVQTPQSFRRAALERAHAAAARDGLTATDDAALLERAGFRVVTVPGDPANRKITLPEDLAWAESVLRLG